MKKHKLKKMFYIALLTISCFCLLSCSGINFFPDWKPNAQTGVSYGYVEDTNMSTLSGATVTCNGQTVTTNTDGAFEFKEMPSGSVQIKATKDGYEEYSNHIGIKSGQAHNVNIIMKPLK